MVQTMDEQDSAGSAATPPGTLSTEQLASYRELLRKLHGRKDQQKLKF